MGRRREAPGRLYTNEHGVLKLDVRERPDREPPPPVEPDGHPPVQPAHGRGRRPTPGGSSTRRWRTGTGSARRPGAATASRGWRACGRASATPRRRWQNLDIYLRAFILRNGFHANGDQTARPASPSSPTARSRSRATSSPPRRCTRCCSRAGARRPGSRDTEVIRVFPAVPAALARRVVRGPAGRGRPPRLGAARGRPDDVVSHHRGTRRRRPHPRHVRRRQDPMEQGRRPEGRRQLRGHAQARGDDRGHGRGAVANGLAAPAVDAVSDCARPR